LVQLQKDSAAIRDAKLQVVGISYDSVEILNDFAKKFDVKFPLLSDPESKAIDAFGIRNQQANGRAAGVPIPATFVIDGEGVVRARLPGTTVQRHSTQQLLEAARRLR